MEENGGHSGFFDWDDIETIWGLEDMDIPDEDIVEITLVDKIDLREVQSNLSALLYIITEQQAVISELLSTLTQAGILSHEGLIRVSGARKDVELTEAVYKDLYKSFIDYYLKTKWMLMSEKERDVASDLLRNVSENLNSPADEKLPKGD